MKKILTLFVALWVIWGLQAQVSQTVNLTTAGSLSTVLTSSQMQTITNLTITGVINNADIATTASMSRDYALEVLDLSNTTGLNAIADSAYQNAYLLQSIVLPNTIIQIGNSAFNECYNLISVTMPSSVASIGRAAFYDCSSLENIELPSSLQSIQDSTFFYCGSLTHLTIPSSVDYIGNDAFSDCSSLDSITIPSSIDSIGKWAFSYCNSLSYVKLSDSLQRINDKAFDGCSSIDSISIPSSVRFIGKAAFYDCRKLRAVDLPDSLITINDEMFYGCTSLDSITIPSTVKTIGSSAFFNCKALKSIQLSDSLSVIADNIFYGCSSLDSIRIPSLVDTIGSNAFYGCIRLKTIHLSDSLKVINTSAFEGCVNLDSIAFPSMVNTIGYSAFSNCKSLKSIVLPDSLTTIDGLLFSGCTSLESVTIPSSVDSIGGAVFQMCSSLKSVVLPDSIKTIPGFTFYGCSSLESVTIPSSVDSIGVAAFYSCKIRSIVLPDSLKYIDNYAFNGCSSLEKINIPSSAIYIGDWAFLGCDNLAINIVSKDVRLSESALSGCKTVQIDPQSKYYVMLDGVLFNKVQDTLILCSTSKKGNYSIPSTVTTIANGGFANCSGLTAINIPSSVTEIGGFAFQKCSGLQTINIPASVSQILNGAFAGCNAITVSSDNQHFLVKDGVLFTKDMDVLLQCSASRSGSYSIPQTVTSLSLDAFSYCNKITSIEVPSSITQIPTNAFSYCEKLLSVSLPVEVTEIGDWAFLNNRSLISAHVPDSVRTIGYATYAGCDSLQSIYLPAALNSIGFSAFYGCKPKNIYCESMYPPGCEYVFDNFDATVFVPKGAKSNYQFSNNDWAKFNKIVEISGSLDTVGRIADTTMMVGDLSQTYKMAKYFHYVGTGSVSYMVYSNNPQVVLAVVNGSNFGLSAYGAGTAKITILAQASTGVWAEQTFMIRASQSCNKFEVAGNVVNNTCFDGNAGSITLTLTDLPENYTCNWSNSMFGSAISGLHAGLYSVIVTDKNNCIASKSFEITSPVLSQDIQSPSCGITNGSIRLSVLGQTQPLKYKWSQGDSSAFVTGLAAGVYTVTISDSVNCKLSQRFELTDNEAPAIWIDSINPSPANKKIGAIGISSSGNTSLYSFVWNDGKTSKNRSNLAPGLYSVTLTDDNGCSSARSIEVPSQMFKNPHIALVTVDSATGKNLIVWLREKTDQIHHYTVYRQDLKGGYTAIGSVAHNEVSVFVDTAKAADPMSQSWIYRLSASSVDGVESALSPIYKTMYLQQNIGLGGVINLEWDNYQGSSYFLFNIYRMSDSRGFERVKQVSSTINRWTDVAPPSDVQYYKVGIDLPESIDPKLTKTDTGPFSQSMSNMSEASLVSKRELVFAGINVYPNPAKDQINISIANADGVLVSLIASSGAVVAKTIIADGKAQFTVSGFAGGLYSVQIHTNKQSIVKTVVVE